MGVGVRFGAGEAELGVEGVGEVEEDTKEDCTGVGVWIVEVVDVVVVSVAVGVSVAVVGGDKVGGSFTIGGVGEDIRRGDE